MHSQREEIDSGLRLLFGNDGGQHRGFAIGRENRAIGLTGHAAGFQNQRFAGPFDFFTDDIEHSFSFLWPHGPSRDAASAADSAGRPMS